MSDEPTCKKKKFWVHVSAKKKKAEKRYMLAFIRADPMARPKGFESHPADLFSSLVCADLPE